jgi:hypothetical protein
MEPATAADNPFLQEDSNDQREDAPTTRSCTDKPMTPQEAADFLGLDEKSITRWARKSYLTGHPHGEGKRRFWRFLGFEFSAWMAAQNNGVCTA